jgi:hypothetical protein
MAIMVPVALYCAVYREGTRLNPFAMPLSPHEKLASTPFAFELAFLATSGVLISFYRRATTLEAVVQWCVPPLTLLASWTILVFFPRPAGLLFLSIVSVVSLASALNWVLIQRGKTNLAWPKHWIGDSILCGFTHLGLIVVCFFPLGCCLAGE